MIKKISSYIWFQIKYLLLNRYKYKANIFSYACSRTKIGKGACFPSVRFIKCEIGKYSYIGKANNTLSNIKVGNYCSIGNNFVVITGAHPTKTFVSTSPLFYSISNPFGFSIVTSQKFDDYIYTDDSFSCEIGHDVWLGFAVRVLGGRKIGNGAIVGACSLVTKDIPAYEIWAGVPAKKIGMRFSRDELLFIEGTEWWAKDIDVLKKYADSFSDLEYFKAKFNDEN